MAALTVLISGYHIALPPTASVLAGACILVGLLRAALTLHQLRALPAARTDPLTGLANRRHLHERCAQLLARPDAAPVTLMMIDLNGFKAVNDRYGHPVGDALLVEIATRLAATMRRDDLLGRLGGDEFAAVLPRTTPPQAPGPEPPPPTTTGWASNGAPTATTSPSDAHSIDVMTPRRHAHLRISTSPPQQHLI